MSREIRSSVYQIDFTAVDAGKRVASSKRRIRWRFGFTNQDALASGETGTACRGEEHDITLIWSLTSGKRLVLADGQEVHYSNSRSQIFDFSWTMRGNHVLKVVAHSTTPMNVHPNFRQYDFFVDGMSFFSMPKVYRLGLTDNTPIQEPATLALAHSSRRSTYGNYSTGGANGGALGRASAPPEPNSIVEIEAPHNAQEEEAYLREAIKASLSDQNEGGNNNVPSSSASHDHVQTNRSNNDENLLIDFMSEPGPAPAPAPASFAVVPSAAPPGNVYTGASHDSGSVLTAPAQYHPYAITQPGVAPPVPMMPQTMPAPAPTMLPHQPAMTYAPQPVAAPPAPTVFQAPAPMPQQVAPPAPSIFQASAPMPQQAAPPAPEAAPVLTMAPQSTGLGSDANAAYAKFANMDQFDLVKPSTAEPSAAINPFDDPVQTTSNQPPPTLAGMKARNQNGGERKEVMKNALVNVPNQAGNWGGAYAAPTGAPQMGQMGGVPSMGGIPLQANQPQYGNNQYGYPQQQQQQQQGQPMAMPQYGMQQGQQFQQQSQAQQPF